MEGIIASVITSLLGLVGIIITNMMSNKQIEHKLETNQAVINTKLDTLTAQVKEHNSNVQLVPVLDEKIKGLELRLDRLETEEKAHK